MINSYAVDVEIFVNLFSVTFVDMKDYLQKFADCVDERGQPMALTEKLSVKEIKERLDTVKTDVFWISDTNDSQLLALVSYINKMEHHYETNIGNNGEVYQIPVRTDLFGFNNSGYDDLMIKAFLMYFNRFDSTKLLIIKLKELSNKIIALQNDKDNFYQDKEIELIRNYRLPYVTVDLQKIFGLHSATVNVDKDTGEREKFGKSLKQTSINLKWHELLDFKLPLIDQEEYLAYWNKIERYKGMTIKELNDLNYDDFDRYVLPKYIEPMLYYNKNDVFLVCEIARQKPDEIKLRYSITSAFKINVLCSARANIADKLTVKFYSDMSGLHKDQFIKKRTERNRLSFKKIIFPHIKFKTKELQDLLNDMKNVMIYHTNKDSFNRTITFYGTTYTLATGGIHSVDPPRICTSDEKYVYLHHDYTSYYPSIMISYNICPEHLNKSAFIKMMTYLKETRVQCKHTKDSEKQIINGVPNKVAAEALKIVINSIYGKLGSELFFLYDRFAQMQVTINGQLMTMTLIEELELNGIHVISANTDGIVIKLPRDKFDIYKDITNKWNETNKMGADYETYKEIVSRDVNNYFDIQENGDIEYKGVLDPKQYIKELRKGYDMPVIALAVFNYFVNNTPVMETLQNHKDILDFCKTQNVGKQFNVVYSKIVNGEIEEVKSQRHVRFYVSTSGVFIKKKHKLTNKLNSLASGLPVQILNSLDDIPIEHRNIDYHYYYEECYKIINPIKLGISSTQKGNKNTGTVSGKILLKKYAQQYQSLFDEDNDKIMKTAGEIFEDAILHWRDNKGTGTAIIPNPFNDKVIVLGVLQRVYTRSPTAETIIVTNNFNERIELIEFLTQQKETENNEEFKRLIESKKLKIFTYKLVESLKYELRPLVCIMYHNDTICPKMLHLLSVAKFKLVVLNKLMQSAEDMHKVYTICPLLDDFKQNELDAIRKSTPVEELWVPITLPEHSEIKKLLNYYNEYISTSLNIFGSFDIMQQARIGNSQLNISAMQLCAQIAESNGWNEHLDMSVQYNVEIDNLYNPSAIRDRANQTYEIIRNRSQLLSDYDGKLEEILNIVKKNQDDKILIINKRGEFANKVTDYINNMSETIICGNYHDKVEPVPAVDINGNILYYKSGNKKGERRFMCAQAQKTLNENLFNLNKLNVLSTNAAPDKTLSIPVDIIIITSPLCEEIETYLYRLIDVYYPSNKIKLYSIYIKDSIEETKLQTKTYSETHFVINKSEKNDINVNFSDFIVVD